MQRQLLESSVLVQNLQHRDLKASRKGLQTIARLSSFQVICDQGESPGLSSKSWLLADSLAFCLNNSTSFSAISIRNFNSQALVIFYNFNPIVCLSISSSYWTRSCSYLSITVTFSFRCPFLSSFSLHCIEEVAGLDLDLPLSGCFGSPVEADGLGLRMLLCRIRYLPRGVFSWLDQTLFLPDFSQRNSRHIYPKLRLNSSKHFVFHSVVQTVFAFFNVVFT